MDQQQWLAELKQELRKRRLPKRYVTRLLQELSDHVTDDRENRIGEDHSWSADRIGSPAAIAESAAQEFRSRRFAVRHPLWTFGALPPFLFVLFVVGVYLGSSTLLEFLLSFAPIEQYEMSAWAPVVAQGYLIGCLLLASVMTVACFAWLAQRYALKRRWPMTAAVIIALLCGSFWTEGTRKTQEQMGRVTIGLPGSFWPSDITFPRVIQFAVPLAAAAWLTSRRTSSTTPSVDLRIAT
ncbi:hypothetical protein LOC68_18630 [Blastopirellula sp. JC732]|uniref:Uncharacterized protein n=1 Tax=Blastopirellula sediminis TaxID=2894196 RepID=A0A9X1SGP7_9BACT|nr:hypothetical protein [Blastopirellula sediminis]MCC9606287.1 hypothetical protein [Blastopirellula sediminis]MCC9630415.1 hypothetical protein [Blastopirellula sediminis]